MTEASARPKTASGVTAESNERRSDSNLDTSGHEVRGPVSEKSEAIIKEVSVRRRSAMRILANR